jgi:hypothetical protein
VKWSTAIAAVRAPVRPRCGYDEAVEHGHVVADGRCSRRGRRALHGGTTGCACFDDSSTIARGSRPSFVEFGVVGHVSAWWKFAW